MTIFHGLTVTRYACTNCGSWSKPCDCRYEAAVIPVSCYVCDAAHDPRVKPPRVCDQCKERYLP